MSLFEEALAPCPRCGRQISFDVCNSVNADRRPDLRQEIVAGTFQHVRCGTCSALVSLPPLLTYLDLGHGQWILAKPASDYPDWATLELLADAAFAASFGAAAPAPARRLGAVLRRRIVFGWPALREKLLAADAGIDDVLLELLKLALMRRASTQPFGDAIEFRLVAVAGDVLELQWLELTSKETVAMMAVARKALEEIADDMAAWQPLRSRLTDGPFVDLTRLLT